MPSFIPTTVPRVVKFTNCRIPRGGQLVQDDVWVDSVTGKILQSQKVFYENQVCPDHIVDLGGRILAPGFIEVQLNGAQGFDFSVPQPTKQLYDDGLARVNRALARMGVTSYLPTITSQRKEVYHQVRHPENICISSVCLMLTRDWLDSTVTRAFRSAPSRGRWCRVTWRTHRRTVSSRT
jgi:N-acetylglucosamine-6-phosphate deacetylase